MSVHFPKLLHCQSRESLLPVILCLFFYTNWNLALCFSRCTRCSFGRFKILIRTVVEKWMPVYWQKPVPIQLNGFSYSFLIKGLSHTICFLLKTLQRFLHRLNSKRNGSALFSKTIFRHWNCFVSSVATDGKDSHGLKLENMWPTFSNFNAMPTKITSKLLWLVLPGEFFIILQ